MTEAEAYLIECKSTFKDDSKINQINHCKLAIPEEVGEIMGELKRMEAYGLDESMCKNRLKLELGDLLYYCMVFSDLTEQDMIESHFDLLYHDRIKFEDRKKNHSFVKMFQACLDIHKYSIYSNEHFLALRSLLTQIKRLGSIYDYTFAEIAESNVKKIRMRHGKSFDESKTIEENRDRNGENNI